MPKQRQTDSHCVQKEREGWVCWWWWLGGGWFGGLPFHKDFGIRGLPFDVGYQGAGLWQFVSFWIICVVMWKLFRVAATCCVNREDIMSLCALPCNRMGWWQISHIDRLRWACACVLYTYIWYSCVSVSISVFNMHMDTMVCLCSYW